MHQTEVSVCYVYYNKIFAIKRKYWHVHGLYMHIITLRLYTITISLEFIVNLMNFPTETSLPMNKVKNKLLVSPLTYRKIYLLTEEYSESNQHSGLFDSVNIARKITFAFGLLQTSMYHRNGSHQGTYNLYSTESFSHWQREYYEQIRSTYSFVWIFSGFFFAWNFQKNSSESNSAIYL